MEARLRKIIEDQKRWPGDFPERLDHELERADVTPTQRANVIATVRYPDWLQRERIMYQDIIQAFREDQEATAILLEQDVKPVNYLYSDLLRTGKEQPNFAQVKTVLLDEVFFNIGSQIFEQSDSNGQPTGVIEWAEGQGPINLPNLVKIDATESGSIDRVLENIFLLENVFPSNVKKRTIKAPKKNREWDLSIYHKKHPLLSIKGSDWEIQTNAVLVNVVNDKIARSLVETLRCEYLEILNLDITESGLKALGKINVKSLCIRAEDLTDDDIATLLNNSSIKELSIDSSKVTGKFVAMIKNANEIRGLGIGGITDEGLEMIIDNCPELEKLEIGFSSITSKGFIPLLKTKKLWELCVSGCEGIDDQAIKTISQIKTLETLYCPEIIIEDEDLKQLAKLERLKYINMNKCEGMTRAGLEKFKQALPECEIEGEETIVFED